MNGFDLSAFLVEIRHQAERRGFITEELLQTSAGPLLAFISRTEGPPAYLSAGIHGDEPAGPLAALELLKSGFFEDHWSWSFCPALNPTGLAAGTRDNAGGIDLNRDYLKLLSPEVKAHAAWLAKRPGPRRFVSLHEDWETSGFYFYEINLADDRPDRAARILHAVSPWFPPEPASRIDDHDIRGPGWIFHNDEADLPDHWPEAIYLAKTGCPLSFTFETPSSGDLADRVASHAAAVRVAMAG